MPASRRTIKTERAASIPVRVVGVAASAGGLDAFTRFLEALPPDTGMAFVLFQHLDPKHESLLAPLLSKKTKLPVSEVRGGERVRRDRVYVVPPNKGMYISEGALHLIPRANRRWPIDFFFESLARDQKERAIGIVLSGEATDGTKGVKAIRDQGGVAFAQDEASALHVGMPRSAAASGAVDYVLPPQEIANKLARMSRAAASIIPDASSSRGKDYYAILDLVQGGEGVDFSDYKPGTINRRIRRRMALRGIPTLAGYAKELRRDRGERSALAQDFLIHVTAFFRDPGVWKALGSKVYPDLLKRRRDGGPIRIWVAGCSTGEEAYSHCINLLEHLGRGSARPDIQVFGTDISEDAVKKARAGVYSEKAVHHVPPGLLAKYFVKVPQGYRIAKPVRDLCVFAKQNVAADTPFSKLDIVSCRNVLIYLGPTLQKKVLEMFHYALKPAGILVLGAAETIDVAADRFGAVDARRRIFINKPFNGAEFRTAISRGTAVPARPAARRIERRPPAPPVDAVALDLPREVDRLLLRRFAPATVVVDDEFSILQFRGPVNRYLEPLPGKASLNLTHMAMESLRLELIGAVERSKKTGDPVRREGLDAQRDGRPSKVDIDVVPIKGPAPSENCWAIVFTDAPAASGAAGTKASEPRRVLRLRRELAESREALQSLMERHEMSRQELASTQEESLAHNEELRSLNEELETAKEELQSTNEELTTINDELNVRNRELAVVGEFAEAIVDTVRESLLVLEEDLRVKSANRSFYETFKLSKEETVGRFIHALAGGQWDIPRLRALLETAFSSSKIKDDLELEHEFAGLGRRQLRFTARRLQGDDVSGKKRVLLAVEDVTLRRELEELETLRKRDEMRREFVAHVSHQFRTPLTAIRGFAETLRQGGAKSGKSHMEFVDTIERHAVRLSRLVDDLLSLSVIEEGSASAHRQSIDVAHFARAYLRTIEPLIAARRISLTVRIPKGIVVKADKALLRQVFQSLCENAIKYSHAGGRIDVEARARDAEAVVSIVDHGIGIPRKDRIRIFEPFHRTRGARVVDPSGTGLGLSIAQKIVKSFGGKIWVASGDGSGSKFTFTVPLA